MHYCTLVQQGCTPQCDGNECSDSQTNATVNFVCWNPDLSDFTNSFKIALVDNQAATLGGLSRYEVSN